MMHQNVSTPLEPCRVAPYVNVPRLPQLQFNSSAAAAFSAFDPAILTAAQQVIVSVNFHYLRDLLEFLKNTFFKIGWPYRCFVQGTNSISDLCPIVRAKLFVQNDLRLSLRVDFNYSAPLRIIVIFKDSFLLEFETLFYWKVSMLFWTT